MLRSLFAGLLLAALTFTLPGCGPAAAPDEAMPSVTVSIAPQRWIVERLEGDRVEVTVLLPAGAAPATWSPSDADVSQLLRSGLWLRIGVPFEQGTWAKTLADHLTVVDVTSAITRRYLGEHHHDHGDHEHVHHDDGADPHVWTTPANLRHIADATAAALDVLAPEHRDERARRLADLHEELDALDAELRATLAPVAGRPFLIFHPSWGYFADAYDLRQIAIEVRGRTPSDAELTAIQTAARDERLTTVFVQPQTARRTADAVAAAIGGRVEELDPLRADVPANLRYAAARFAEVCAAP